MGASTNSVAARARLAGALAAVAVILAPARPADAAVGCTAVIGQATSTPAQLAQWFATTGRTPKLDVSVLDLATMFVEEGARESVRGDIAFAQSIVETGYFGFSPSVPPDMHNYSGIGATGGGVKGAGFPDARTGVRAQVQHLRAYADPALRSAADLHAPLVDPRFGFLVPNSRPVPCWEQFGNGVWAADPTGYGPRVLAVHQRFPTAPPAPAAPAVVAPPVTAVEAPAPAPPAADLVLPPGGAVAADLATAPALSFEALEASEAALATRPAVATAEGSGLAIASALAGVGLLSLCTTLWWHGRRFSSRSA